MMPISWLHVPKTGSSFGLAVYLHACQPLPSDISLDRDHPPIKDLTTPFPPEQYCAGGFVDTSRLDGHCAAQWPQDDGRLVSIFRDPYSQKLSMLRFIYSEFNTTSEEDGSLFYWSLLGHGGQQLRFSQSKASIVSTLVNLTSALIASGTEAHTKEARCHFLKFVLPRLRGCQSKMLSGHLGCLSLADDTPNPPASDPHHRQVPTIASVSRSLSKMAFIGLTERWAESVCLFHRQLHSAPTKQLPWAVEFSDTRPTRSTAEEIDWAVESKRCGVEPYLFTDSRDVRSGRPARSTPLPPLGVGVMRPLLSPRTLPSALAAILLCCNLERSPLRNKPQSPNKPHHQTYPAPEQTPPPNITHPEQIQPSSRVYIQSHPHSYPGSFWYHQSSQRRQHRTS